MSEVQTAERIVRRFARDTNLLLAARAARVRPGAHTAPLVPVLERMLRDLGVRIVSDHGLQPRVILGVSRAAMCRS